MKTLLLLALIASAAVAQAFEGCEDLRDTARLQWLDCNGDRYAQEQCITDLECFCVYPITGNRMEYMSYRRGDHLSCNDGNGESDYDYDDFDFFDYDFEFDEEDCLDHDLMVLLCGGRNCIREPYSNETCRECIDGCTGTLHVDQCNSTADCPSNSTCVASGVFGELECVESIPEGGMCLLDDDYGQGFDFYDYDDYDFYDDYEDDYYYDYDFDFEDDEEDIFQSVLFLVDSAIEFAGRECPRHQVCRRVNSTTSTCQNRTGPCFDRGGHSSRERGRQGFGGGGSSLRCIDDGTFDPEQSDGIEHWCVYPGNGSEIPNTRSRGRPRKCNDLVYQDCTVMINDFEFDVFHGDMGVRVTGNTCSECLCNSGAFTFCENIQCPFTATPTAVQSCTEDGTTYEHGETFDSDCNICVCINGEVVCTHMICPDDEDDDDDTQPSGVSMCHTLARRPVCARDLRTYPNLCAAQAAGFNQLEVAPGACTRQSICNLHPCGQGLRCFPLATSCTTRSSCSADDYRVCVNASTLRCPVINSTANQVCGLNGRTYSSVCQMLQLSDTQVRFPGSCNRSDCTNNSVCGTDGVTYRTICDLRSQPNVRVDYGGNCVTLTANETVNTFCARVRASGRCPNRTNCSTITVPSDGCCPICGGGLSIAYDQNGLDSYDDIITEARTTNGMGRIMTRSRVVSDPTNRCLVEAEFTSNGDLELLYVARNNSDASACAAQATIVANYINNVARGGGVNRRRRQEEQEVTVDPIFSYMIVASTLEQVANTTDDTPANNSAGVTIPNTFILSWVLVLLLMLMLVN